MHFSIGIGLVLLVVSTIDGLSSNQTIKHSKNQTNIEPTISIRKMARYTNDDTPMMSEIGSRCTEDGFFPDRDDCRKFHVCYGGIQSVRWCKEGMLWDEAKIGCSNQNLTPCSGGRKRWTKTEEVITTTTTMTTTTTTTSHSPSTAAAKNSSPFRGNYTCRSGATGFFADPSSCSIYHWCVVGVLQSTHRCNAGLHFSASANGCLWPKDAECEGQISPSYSAIECAIGTAGYFPDPYDCSVFHYCDGIKTHSDSLLCSSGLVWSSRLESCAWPHEVTECQNSCPPTYPSQMRFADPVICSQYVQCVDGHLEQRSCPTNLLFDRITKTCKPYDQAECHGAKPESTTTSSPLSPSSQNNINQDFDTSNSAMGNTGPNKKQRTQRFTCLVDGYFGDPQDCRVFHACVDGHDFRSICGTGLGWEPILRLCMPTQQVSSCQSSKSYETSAGSSRKKWFPSFTRSVVKMTTTASTTTTTTTTATPFALPSVFTCAGRTNGYYADPIDCQKFHYCATGWHSLMECDQGLAYSAQENDCVPLALTECGNRRSLRKKF